MSRITVEMDAREHRLLRAMQNAAESVNKIEERYRGVGQTAQAAGRTAAQSTDGWRNALTGVWDQVKGLGAMLGVGGGIVGGVSLVQRSFEAWLEVLQDITMETRKAGGEIIAFAALQEGGTKAQRVMEASALAQRYGITERGEAYETVQAMQSVLGDYEAGLKAAESIFQASQVGISVDLGRELEIMGITAGGLQPGQAIRKAYAAGELSGRTPAAIARASEAFPFFEDPDLMFAVAAQLAGGVPESQIATYTKRTGMALSPMGNLGDWYRDRGLAGEPTTVYEEAGVDPRTGEKLWEAREVGGPDVTQMDRLRALAEAGVGEQELREAGLTEVRERQALATAIARFREVAEGREKIPTLATETLFLEKRAGIEEELPWMAHERQLDQLTTMYQEAKVHVGTGEEMRERVEMAIRGTAMRRLGMDRFWFKRLIKEDESGTPTATWAAERMGPLAKESWWEFLTMTGARTREQWEETLEAEMEQVRRELEAGDPSRQLGGRVDPQRARIQRRIEEVEAIMGWNSPAAPLEAGRDAPRSDRSAEDLFRPPESFLPAEPGPKVELEDGRFQGAVRAMENAVGRFDAAVGRLETRAAAEPLRRLGPAMEYDR